MNEQRAFALTVTKNGTLEPEEGFLQFLGANPGHQLTVTIRPRSSEPGFSAGIVVTKPTNGPGKEKGPRPEQHRRF